MSTGLLLINIGTPNAPTITAVYAYLAKFLSDARILNLPAFLRYLLVYGMLVPWRMHKSKQAYQAIWDKQGSPLMLHSHNLVTKLQKTLGAKYVVALGMRYGKPSIASALRQLAQCDKLIILPLYPQYASESTGSAIEYTLRCMQTLTVFPNIAIIRDFHNHSGFIKPLAEKIRPYLLHKSMVLFSFHAIPERALGSHQCYRTQCFATAQAVATMLKLPHSAYQVGFQSHLKKSGWTQPQTIDLLLKCRQANIEQLLVVCPSFVADCLETEEEIAIRLHHRWLELGGKHLQLIPCLNDDDAWVQGIIEMIADH